VVPVPGVEPGSLSYGESVLPLDETGGSLEPMARSRTRTPVIPRPWTALIRHRHGGHGWNRTNVSIASGSRSAVDPRAPGRAQVTCTPLCLHPKQAGRSLPLSPWRERRESHPLWLGHGQPCKALTLRSRELVVGVRGNAPRSAPYREADLLLIYTPRQFGAASGFRPRDLLDGDEASY
jgi:hypothetical protein